jgi:signal transduction histidine kinase
MDSTTRDAGQSLDASHRLLETSEREVQRILLDIHDGPVQYMYAALSQLDLLRRALEKCGPGDAQREAHDRGERIRRLLEDGLKEIRSFIGAQRTPEFAARDLEGLLEGSILQHEALSDTEVVMEIRHPLPEVGVPVKIALYRVVQEALSNSYRHGGASRVDLRIGIIEGVTPRTLRLTLEDNGAGFDPQAFRGPDHFGIAGMRDRVEMVGGCFAIESRPGGGTTVIVEIMVAE